MGDVPSNLIPVVAIIGGCAVAIFVPMVRAYARRMERHASTQKGPRLAAANDSETQK